MIKRRDFIKYILSFSFISIISGCLQSDSNNTENGNLVFKYTEKSIKPPIMRNNTVILKDNKKLKYTTQCGGNKEIKLDKAEYDEIKRIYDKINFSQLNQKYNCENRKCDDGIKIILTSGHENKKIIFYTKANYPQVLDNFGLTLRRITSKYDINITKECIPKR